MSRSAYRATFALLALLISCGASLAADLKLENPRATFDTFLQAMIDAKAGDRARLDDAAACLDLAAASALLKGQSKSLAGDLKTYLDKTELIRLADIPDNPEGERYVYRRTTNGEVSLVRKSDGRWLFSVETVRSLPALLDSVRDKNFVEGIVGGGGAPGSIASWLRGYLPNWAADRTFLLENWQWLGLLLLAMLGVIVDRIVRALFHFWIRKLLKQSASVRETRADADFEQPIGILAMALLWWALIPLFDLPLFALAALMFAAKLLAAVAGVWAAYKLVDLVAEHFAALAKRTETQVDDIVVPMVRRALKIAVIAFGIVFVAQNLDIDVTSLLAGLGIGGLAFALAAKDTVENLFGSMTVLIDRPFQIGDWIVLGDQEGTVEEIGFRSTRVRTFYNSVITIPNSLLVRSAVDNLGARRYRRWKTLIGVQYDTAPEKLDAFCEGIRALIREHPYTRKDYYMVYLNGFADSSLNILLYVFHETPDWPTELRERHRLMVDIVRLAERLDVSFAFPTQTVHLHSEASGPALGPVEELNAAAHTKLASPESASDPAQLGAQVAKDILKSGSRDHRQEPVDFTDPARVRTDR